MADKKGRRVTYSGSKPLQKIPESKKTKEWEMSNIDWIIGAARSDIGNSKYRMLYELYNNIFPEQLFHYVQNPFNSTKEEYQNLPARVRPYTILRNSIDLFLGEFKKRPFDYQVKVHNADAVNIQREEEQNNMLRLLQQVLEGYIQDEDKFAELAESFPKNYMDARAIMGQDALSYLLESEHIFEKLNDAFKDFLIAGIAVTYKTVRREEIVYETVNPIQFAYDKSSNSKYIEDGDWALQILKMSANEIVDLFYDELTPAQIDELENSTHISLYTPNVFNRLFREGENDELRQGIEVIRVTWKSYKKIGIYKYIDEFGVEQETLLPEGWQLSDEEKAGVEWLWVTEVREGYRVDGDIYLGMKVLPAQRNEINNKSSCKLPYNGRRYSDRNAPNISVMELGLPYQVLYIIILHQIELTLQKNHGKVMLMDLGAVPNHGDWDEEKFMYYAKALGFMFISPNQEDASKNFNQYTSIDLSTLQHASQLIEMAEYIKRSWEETIGLTQQRKGNISASETVGNASRAVFQSSVISEELFTEFDDFVEKEIKGLLDLSKMAWINGKKSTYINNENRQVILDIEPDSYVESDLGVIVSNSYKDAQVLDMMKQQAQSFAQNGYSPISVLEMLRAESVSKLRELLKDELAKLELKQQQAQEAEQQMKEQELQLQQSLAEAQQNFEKELLNLKYDREEQLKYIDNGIDVDGNDNGVSDLADIEKIKVAREKIMIDKQIAFKQLAQDREEMYLKASTEKYKSDKQAQRAKTSKK